MNNENELQLYLNILPNKFGIYLFNPKNLENYSKVTFNSNSDFINYEAKNFLITTYSKLKN